MSSAIRSSQRPCSTVCSTTPSSSRLKAQAIACASTPPSCRKTARPGPRRPSKPTCHVVADDHRKTEAPIHNPADHRSLHLGNFRPPEMGKIRSPLTPAPHLPSEKRWIGRAAFIFRESSARIYDSVLGPSRHCWTPRRPHLYSLRR